MRDLFGNEVNKETAEKWEEMERIRQIGIESKEGQEAIKFALEVFTDEQKEKIIEAALKDEETKKHIFGTVARNLIDNEIKLRGMKKLVAETPEGQERIEQSIKEQEEKNAILKAKLDDKL